MEPASLRRKARRVHEILLDFFGEPVWGNPLPALDELVSTILSQNTNDINRDRAFEALRKKMPTWEAVRDAPLAQVVEAIRPAGLANQKGPRIQKALRQITEERGQLDIDFLREWSPEEVRAWLTRFHGVGPKTASIVMQFSLRMPAFAVDTHVHRITGRLGLRPANMSADNTHALMESLLLPDTYGVAHMNLIRLGREVCGARRPDCPNCPLRRLCLFYKNGGTKAL